MKKNFLPAFLLLFLALGLFSCQQGTKETNKEYPMFWTWLDYRPGMNFDSICQVMNDIGMDGIMLNAPTPDDYRVAIPIAHKHGIEVYAWLWTMNLEHDRDKILKEHPEWFSVNRNGKSLADTTAYVGYYKFLCPALPEVREFIKEKIKAYCEVEGLNGIAIDYHRFVDVVLPTTLWPRYGIVQDREYAAWDYGYHVQYVHIVHLCLAAVHPEGDNQSQRAAMTGKPFVSRPFPTAVRQELYGEYHFPEVVQVIVRLIEQAVS